MKLTQKLVVIFFTSLIVTMVSVYFLSSHFFLNSFQEVENEIAYRDLERVKQAINDEIENLVASSSPWSLLPETLELEKNPRATTIQQEIESPTIFSARFRQLFLIDNHFKIVFSKSFNSEDKTFQEIEPEQTLAVNEQMVPLLQREPTQLHKGIFIGSGRSPFLFAIWPLLGKDPKKSPTEYFVVLRAVDRALRARLQEILQMEMNFSVGAQEEWNDNLKDRGILLVGANRIQGLVGFPDYFGKGNLIARVDIRRAIYGLGQKTVWSFLGLMCLLMIGIYGLVFVVFHRDALRKIFRMKKQMTEIGNGRLKRLTWSGHDEVAKLAQNINQMLDKLEQSQVMINRASKFSALGEMAGSIAHEINNPLAIITGFCHKVLRLLERDPIDKKEVSQTTERILNTAHRIDHIIQSLRLVSRDGERDAKQEVPLGDILKEVVTLSESTIVHENITLRTDRFDKKQNVNVRFVQIVQVLLNLLNNSIDAISHLSERWVEFRTEVDGQMVHIYVIDSGGGIASDLTDKVMEPFFTTKEIGKGSGLGLSISKGIIESHNGTFTLIKEATNTTFKISLPR